MTEKSFEQQMGESNQEYLQHEDKYGLSTGNMRMPEATFTEKAMWLGTRAAGLGLVATAVITYGMSAAHMGHFPGTPQEWATMTQAIASNIGPDALHALNAPFDALGDMVQALGNMPARMFDGDLVETMKKANDSGLPGKVGGASPLSGKIPALDIMPK